MRSITVIIILLAALAITARPAITAAAGEEFTASKTAELFLQPDYASFLDKNTLLVDIVVNPNSQAINAANINLAFDQNKLAAAAISYHDNPFSEFIISEKIDNKQGVIKIACGTAANDMAATTVIARISFTKILSGFAKFNLSGSEILAADGLGANILAYPEIHNIYIIK